MNIGILGPADSIEKIMALKGEFSGDITLVPYEAFSIKNSTDLLEQCQRETDGILFTGPTVHDNAVSAYPLDTPNVFVPHNETGLFQLIATHDISGFSFISVDMLEHEVVRQCLAAFPHIDFDVLPFQRGYTEHDYLDFHLKNCHRHPNTLVLTTFTPIAQYFHERNMPAYRLYTSAASVKGQIQNLAMEIRSRKLDHSKIAVQVIQLHSQNERITQTLAMENLLEFEAQLIPYVRLIEGSFFSYGRNEYILFSTKGLITRKEAYASFYQIIKTSRFSVFSGIGMGSAASLAEFNANKAIEHSLYSGVSSFFVMSEDGVLAGPMLDKNAIAIDVADTSEQVNLIAQKTGLSIGYVKKLQGLLAATGKDMFSTEEMAEFLNISRRSARRILKLLVDGGCAEVWNKISRAGAGRPQNFVKIHWGG